jgi:N-acetylglucosaminyldiphosphoundecaprenol N-acetyl-beta-D-mannosaminyltransferase
MNNDSIQNVAPIAVPFDTLADAPAFVVLPTTTSAAVERPATTCVWGTDFARVTMADTLALADAVVQRGKPEYFVTANVNYLMLTEQHPRLAEINARSIAVIADGQPIVKRSRREANPLPARVAGSDMIVELARLAADKGYRIYFLGGEPGVARAAADELLRRYPRLQIAGCSSPPFRPLTAAEHNEILHQIRESKPDMLFVAFGQPKGEFWIYDNLHDLSVPLSIQLGASFDFLAGKVRRAPKFWQASGCEWLYRACSSPRRLGPRYLANIRFLLKKIVSESLGFSSASNQG